MRGWHFESYRHSLAAKGVKTVDLKRYAGTWRQKKVINEPWFQKGCQDVTATYKLRKDGKVDVINKCQKDGKIQVAKGIARSVSQDNKKLKVGFFPFGLFEGNYEIVELNPNYTQATVKSGKTVWTLERNRKI
jgi:apolipoprotein D and lipocalin family protein